MIQFEYIFEVFQIFKPNYVGKYCEILLSLLGFIIIIIMFIMKKVGITIAARYIQR